MKTQTPESHLAIMARMILRSPCSKLGRTQLMKLCYFLQEIEGVSTRYHFRLFNYGPFQSEVLSDLGTACSRGILNEEAALYNRGYGYEITPGESAQKLCDELDTSDPQLARQIDRIVSAFGKDGAGELELKSTILFVDREFLRDDLHSSSELIATRVRSIKPHFELEAIMERIEDMNRNGWLESLKK